MQEQKVCLLWLHFSCQEIIQFVFSNVAVCELIRAAMAGGPSSLASNMALVQVIVSQLMSLRPRFSAALAKVRSQVAFICILQSYCPDAVISHPFGSSELCNDRWNLFYVRSWRGVSLDLFAWSRIYHVVKFLPTKYFQDEDTVKGLARIFAEMCEAFVDTIAVGWSSSAFNSLARQWVSTLIFLFSSFMGSRCGGLPATSAGHDWGGSTQRFWDFFNNFQFLAWFERCACQRVSVTSSHLWKQHKIYFACFIHLALHSPPQAHGEASQGQAADDTLRELEKERRIKIFHPFFGLLASLVPFPLYWMLHLCSFNSLSCLFFACNFQLFLCISGKFQGSVSLHFWDVAQRWNGWIQRYKKKYSKQLSLPHVSSCSIHVIASWISVPKNCLFPSFSLLPGITFFHLE